MAITVNDINKLESKSLSSLREVSSKYSAGRRYYEGDNDIAGNDESVMEYKARSGSDNVESLDDPLRRANNKVPSNFYQILVDQEAGYLATHEPTFDVGDDKTNKTIKATLGDSLSLTIQNLIVETSNAGVGWIHYWIDSDNHFKYGLVTPEQIFPIYADSLENELIAVERVYQAYNPDKKGYNKVVEYWTDESCTSFIKDSDEEFQPYNQFSSIDITTGTDQGATNVYNHGLGSIPFIKFRKNIYEKPELDKVKGSIDIYDKVYNGFANDLQDIQQTMIILKDYGGTDLNAFMDQLKKYKAINVDSDGDVSQLQIEIPVEARQTMLDITKQKIFDEGQGIDPNKFMDNGALSGKAIKGLYAHLDLKASTTEKNFREGFASLIRAIMRFLDVSDYATRNVSQTWTRNAIQDDLERAQAIAQLAPHMSNYAIAAANPFIDDIDAELKHQSDERVNYDGYGDQSQIDKLTGNSEEDE